MEQVIKPLLGEQYIEAVFLVPITKEVLDAIDSAIRPCRPPGRIRGLDCHAEEVECSKDWTAYCPPLCPKLLLEGYEMDTKAPAVTIELKVI